jgi:hypothetical protein
MEPMVLDLEMEPMGPKGNLGAPRSRSAAVSSAEAAAL